MDTGGAYARIYTRRAVASLTHACVVCGVSLYICVYKELLLAHAFSAVSGCERICEKTMCIRKVR